MLRSNPVSNSLVPRGLPPVTAAPKRRQCDHALFAHQESHPTRPVAHVAPSIPKPTTQVAPPQALPRSFFEHDDSSWTGHMSVNDDRVSERSMTVSDHGDGTGEFDDVDFDRESNDGVAVAAASEAEIARVERDARAIISDYHAAATDEEQNEYRKWVAEYAADATPAAPDIEMATATPGEAEPEAPWDDAKHRARLRRCRNGVSLS